MNFEAEPLHFPREQIKSIELFVAHFLGDYSMGNINTDGEASRYEENHSTGASKTPGKNIAQFILCDLAQRQQRRCDEKGRWSYFACFFLYSDTVESMISHWLHFNKETL